MSTVPVQQEPTQRRLRGYILAGCLTLLLLACVAAGAIGGLLYLRNQPSQVQGPSVEYILDSSPRMSQSVEGGSRLEVARGVLSEIVRPANPDLAAALRVFGSGAMATTCQDTQLIVPFAPSNQGRIADRLADVNAGLDSESPMNEAIIAAIKDLAANQGRHALVVVTGGGDSCNPQAAELIRQEAQRAGIDLKTYVIGFQVLPDQAEALKSLVGSIPGAIYLQADNADQLRTILGQVQAEIDHPSGSTASLPSTATSSATVTLAPPTKASTPTPAVPDLGGVWTDNDHTIVIVQDGLKITAAYVEDRVCDHRDGTGAVTRYRNDFDAVLTLEGGEWKLTSDDIATCSWGHSPASDNGVRLSKMRAVLSPDFNTISGDWYADLDQEWRLGGIDIVRQPGVPTPTSFALPTAAP